MREEFVMKTVDNVHLSQRISKYSAFCHAKQVWNLYLKREAVAENSIATG